MGHITMAAQFGSKPDLAKLNDFLLDKSYISGWECSAEDVAVFKALSSAPGASHVNALRWWNHINSYKADFAKFGSCAAAAEDEDDDDDMDFFGSDDDDEVDAAAEALKQKRVDEYNARKAKKAAEKGVVAAKSMITLDVKPWDDETDLDELAKMIKTIEMDGLVWGQQIQKKPLAFGIFKLVVTAVVEDEKVSTDDLTEQIEGFEDHVQSVDIAAFNKL